MKKFILALIILLIVCGLTFYSIDKQCVSNNIPPKFAIHTSTYKDGGTKEYYGLGYKIIKYNVMGNNGEITKNNSEIGSFFLKYNS